MELQKIKTASYRYKLSNVVEQIKVLNAEVSEWTKPLATVHESRIPKLLPDSPRRR